MGKLPEEKQKVDKESSFEEADNPSTIQQRQKSRSRQKKLSI